LKAHDFAVIFQPKKGAVKLGKTELEKVGRRPQPAGFSLPQAQGLGLAESKF
jgi:hypothetical protein